MRLRQIRQPKHKQSQQSFAQIIENQNTNPQVNATTNLIEISYIETSDNLDKPLQQVSHHPHHQRQTNHLQQSYSIDMLTKRTKMTVADKFTQAFKMSMTNRPQKRSLGQQGKYKQPPKSNSLLNRINIFQTSNNSKDKELKQTKSTFLPKNIANFNLFMRYKNKQTNKNSLSQGICIHRSMNSDVQQQFVLQNSNKNILTPQEKRVKSSRYQKSREKIRRLIVEHNNQIKKFIKE